MGRTKSTWNKNHEMLKLSSSPKPFVWGGGNNLRTSVINYLLNVETRIS